MSLRSASPTDGVVESCTTSEASSTYLMRLQATSTHSLLRLQWGKVVLVLGLYQRHRHVQSVVPREHRAHRVPARGHILLEAARQTSDVEVGALRLDELERLDHLVGQHGDLSLELRRREM